MKYTFQTWFLIAYAFGINSKTRNKDGYIKKRWELKFENTDKCIKTETWRMVTAKQKIKMLVFKKAIEDERQEHEYNHS